MKRGQNILQVCLCLPLKYLRPTILPSIQYLLAGYHVPGSVLGSWDTVGEADIDLAVKLAFQPVCTVFMKSVQIMLVYFVKTAKKTWFHLHMIPSSLIQQLDCNHNV